MTKIDLHALYIDLHQNPELSFCEVRTAAIAAETLRSIGYEVTEGVGKTGVVAVLENGAGPVVWLRADMDALPVLEETGLPYASTARGVDPAGADVPVMHACGHDMHVTAMMGAAEQLFATRADWAGTVVILIQPAEELGLGSRAMLDDGLLDRFPKPSVVLGQHITPLPAGTIAVRPGPQMAAADGLSVTLYGRGGHGSRPQATIDPVVMAASAIMQLQTVVARDVDPRELAVVTVGAVHSGLKSNIIPSDARLEISMRYATEETGAAIRQSVERVIRGVAASAGAPQEPRIEAQFGLPATVNDPAATARIIGTFSEQFGADNIVDIGVLTGSEDVSWFARDAGVPLVFWFWGGLDAAEFAAASAAGTVDTTIPTPHSALFAPIIEPTLSVGIQALTTGAREFLD